LRRLNMKRITRYIIAVILLVFASSIILGLSSSAAFAVDFGPHDINFMDAYYDAGTNTTTFTYQVSATTNYGFDYWFLALNPECFGPGHVVDASEPWEYVENYLGSEMKGIKFTQPYAPDEMRIVWFKIKGNLIVDKVRAILTAGCTNWFEELEGPECGGVPEPPPGIYNGRSPGYWGHQLAVYLGYNRGKFHEKAHLADYLAEIGYSAEMAYAILWYGGSDMVSKLHRQLVAAKLNVAAGYLSGMDVNELIDLAEYMVDHPGEFTEKELEDVKDKLDELNNTGE
jgi:hypothetical protein